MYMNNEYYLKRLQQLQLYRIELEVAKFIQNKYKNGRCKLIAYTLLSKIREAKSSQIPNYILKGYPEKQILEYFFQDFSMGVLHNQLFLLDILKQNKKYIPVGINKTALDFRIDELENKIVLWGDECHSYRPIDVQTKFKEHKYKKIIDLLLKNDFSVEDTILTEHINKIKEKEVKTMDKRRERPSQKEELKIVSRTINNNLVGTGWRLKSNKKGRHELVYISPKK